MRHCPLFFPVYSRLVQPLPPFSQEEQWGYQRREASTSNFTQVLGYKVVVTSCCYDETPCMTKGDLFWPMVPEGESIMAREVQQPEARKGSRAMTSQQQTQSREHELPKSTPECTSSSKAILPEDSIPSTNSSTNGGPST